MVDTGVFATTAEVGYKVGAGASATANTEAFINNFMFQAEGYLNSVCRYNFSDNYATLNDDTKGILNEAATCIAAIYVVQYDMSGYDSRIEAEDIINVLRDSYLRCIQLLRDKKVSDFIREVA